MGTYCDKLNRYVRDSMRPSTILLAGRSLYINIYVCVCAPLGRRWRSCIGSTALRTKGKRLDNAHTRLFCVRVCVCAPDINRWRVARQQPTLQEEEEGGVCVILGRLACVEQKQQQWQNNTVHTLNASCRCIHRAGSSYSNSLIVIVVSNTTTRSASNR